MRKNIERTFQIPNKLHSFFQRQIKLLMPLALRPFHYQLLIKIEENFFFNNRIIVALLKVPSFLALFPKRIPNHNLIL